MKYWSIEQGSQLAGNKSAATIETEMPVNVPSKTVVLLNVNFESIKIIGGQINLTTLSMLPANPLPKRKA